MGGPKGYGSGAAPGSCCNFIMINYFHYKIIPIWLGQEGAAEALTKTKEQLAEEKAICLSIRIKV